MWIFSQSDCHKQRETGDPEAGFILLAVLFLVAVLMIGLAVAAPQIAKSIQRDREEELVRRGEQYKRAIKLYYKKFGAYPTSVDQLVQTNQIRFLRKRYTDPMTGKDDWKLVLMGQAHLRPLGFFGQPLSVGGISSSIGVSTGNIYAISPTTGTGTGSSSDSGSGSSTDGSSSSTSSNSGSSSGSSFGSSNSGSSFGSSSSFGSNTPGSSSSPFSSSPSGTSGSGFGSSSGSSSGSSFGSVGPFVGVVIPSTKTSLVEYKKQKHYNQWEFIYDPVEDQAQAAASLTGGGGGVGTTTGTGTGTTGFGNSSSPFSNSNGSPTSNSPFGSSSGGSSGSGSSSGSSGSSGTGSSPSTNPPNTNQ